MIAFQKLAAEKNPESAPANNLGDVTSDFRRVKGDTKKYLGHLFANTGAYTSNTNKELSRLFPGSKEKEIGGQLAKTARFAYKFAMQSVPMLKTASPNYHEVMFLSFKAELEKIAAISIGKPTGIAGKTLGAAAQQSPLARIMKQQQLRQAQPTKAWDVSSMAKKMGIT